LLTIDFQLTFVPQIGQKLFLKTYLGNGNVVWTNGEIKVADKKQEATKEEISSDLPF